MGLCHLQAKPFLAHTTREFIFSAWLSPPIWLEHAAIMFHHQFKSWWGTVDLQTRSDNSHNFYHWINTMNRQWKRFFLQFEGHCTTDYSACEENWFHRWFMDWTDSENILMMRTCMNVLLETLPCFRNRLVWLLLEAWDSSTKGIGFAYREELLEEHIGASFPCGGFIFIGVEPLLHLPKQWEWEKAKADGIRHHPLDGEGTTHLHEVLEVGFRVLMGIPTKWVGLHLIDKHSPSGIGVPWPR